MDLLCSFPFFYQQTLLEQLFISDSTKQSFFIRTPLTGSLTLILIFGDLKILYIGRYFFQSAKPTSLHCPSPASPFQAQQIQEQSDYLSVWRRFRLQCVKLQERCQEIRKTGTLNGNNLRQEFDTISVLISARSPSSLPLITLHLQLSLLVFCAFPVVLFLSPRSPRPFCLQWSKLNSETLLLWLKARGVNVGAKHRKEELMMKVMSCLAEA